jgi:hypothetical protein
MAVLIYFALAGPLLNQLKRWRAHNNALVTAVVTLVIRGKFVVDALGDLAGEWLHTF